MVSAIASSFPIAIASHKTHPNPGLLATFAALLLVGEGIIANHAQAQVVPDNTLGPESSIVTPLDLTTQRVDGGAVRDSHLFHSFLEFGVPDSMSVYFADPDNISTIFSRVTGNNPSEIYGTLGVLGDANLFLLNPNGVLFGPEAELDMEGSFVGSTADSLLLPDGTEFSTTDPATLPMLDIQVSAPVGLVFEGVNPGVIVNAGNLEVGQNLLLAGGTIVSAGDLVAPSGEVTAVTAVGSGPGQVVVSQTGQLVDVTSAEIATDLPPDQLFLPQWSTLAGLTDNNNQLSIGDSSVTVAMGDTVIQRVTAESSTLSAANNLTLVDSQVVIQGDLDLLAQDSVQILDSETQPVIVAAAGDLVVQGNDQVDIFALNHADSGLFSGGDMTLLSNNPIIGDAHFYANGNVSAQQLNGVAQDVLSFIDPIILAGGNVTLKDYQTGTSLHILAGGSVTLEAVTINGPGPVDSTINPNNTDTINGSLTYADLATFEVPDYEVTVNDDGTFTREQVQRTINIDGSAEATLDVRAGIDWESLGGLPINSIIVGNPLPLPDISEPPTDGSITINGDIEINQPDGRVFLTNQYRPNTTLAAGTIETQGIDTSSRVFANGGDILIYGRGDITTNGELLSGVLALNTSAGNGGAITLSSSSGNILTKDRLESNSSSLSSINPADFSENGGAINLSTDLGDITTHIVSSLSSSAFASGNGGNITISANEGNITTTNFSLISSSISFGDAEDGGDVAVVTGMGDITVGNRINTRSFSRDSTASDGGNISLITDAGDISVSDEVNSFSGSSEGDAGNAGDVLLSARNGDIAGIPMLNSPSATINSLVYAPEGAAGVGGTVTLNARNEISNLDILTLSTSADAGAVEINGTNDLSINDTQIFTNRQVFFRVPFVAAEVEVEIGDEQGQAGDVTITGLGDITFNDIAIESDTKGVDIAGNVTVNSPGQVTFNNSGILSNTSGSGQAGTIEINASDVLLTGTVTLDGTAGPSRLLAQTTSDGAAGNVIFKPFDQGQTLSLTFEDETQISAATQDSGTGGNITFSAPQSVTIAGLGEISASTSGEGAGGSITISAPQSVTIAGPSEISASTFGEGAGGSITISASQSVSIAGLGEISASTSGEGAGGSITISAPQSVTVSGPGELSASTSGSGPGGNIEIKTGTFSLKDDALLTANGTGSGIAGDIEIETSQTDILTGARISVSNPQGQAGNINIMSNSLQLDEGQITAETGQSSTGQSSANITLILGENLLLSNESLISAEAFGEAKGGNIDIDTEFLVALPVATSGDGNNAGTVSLNGSDIIAIASLGNGGLITIDALGIFGIEERPAIPGNQTNDIDASSEFGNPGDVDLSTVEDPSQNLTVLPEDPVDTQVTDTCYTQSGTNDVTLFMLGRSGSPSQSDDVLGANLILDEWLPLENRLETLENRLETSETTVSEIVVDQLPTEVPSLQVVCHHSETPK